MLPGAHRVLTNKRGKFYLYIYAYRGAGSDGRIASFMGRSKAEVEAQERAAAPTIAAKYASSCGSLTPRSMRQLVEAYKASEFPNLMRSTQRVWARPLDEITEFFGATSLTAMEHESARRVIKRWHEQKRKTPRAADTRLTVLVRVLEWGIDESLLKVNRALKIERLHEDGQRSGIIWDKDELSKLLAECPPEVARAVRLAALTGLRKSHIVGLQWEDVKRDMIFPPRRQGTKKKRGMIPLYPALRDLLDECRKFSAASANVIVNTRGVAWQDGDSFDSSFRPALRKCGVKKRFHDLRGTAATNMYKAGLSITQIAGIMGWEEDEAEKIARHYVDIEEASKTLAASTAKTDQEVLTAGNSAQ